ncbi:Tetratricopeptide domain protein [Ignavibacterium album JCM 16511]|uniref:Tetratricopeptide domain protein n=1 Tax=Ignavibacterium album (strain DSM 19864 / JCM 16511 / NBRC 101810 / Mat9-16) TaxID=945713 RepID=I0AHR0_IGNAJ|nr:tetratricopeptide repeat protein [Ignavibacterium album]AFH48517.1 Tetratricopeptide domain protein [Ignavibacterium album JCM 16511]
MLTKRKKLTKKEIKEDKLVEFYYKVQNYIEENKNQVLMYAGALAIVVVAVIFYVNFRNSKNEEAGALLARVIDLYDQGSYLEAIEGKQGTNLVGLKKIVEDYGSTENGETAKIYLANAYSFLGQYEKAFELYKDYSGSNDIYKAAALAGQAGYFASKGEFEKAADLFKKAANVSEINPSRPDYLLRAGINYLKAGQKDEAKALFQIIKDDFKTSTAFAQVDRYFTELN